MSLTIMNHVYMWCKDPQKVVENSFFYRTLYKYFLLKNTCTEMRVEKLRTCVREFKVYPSLFLCAFYCAQMHVPVCVITLVASPHH